MKKVNILLDDDTFDKLKAVTFTLDKSPTELLKPYIERIIRDNAETVKKKLLFTADQFTDADKTVVAKNGDCNEAHLMPKNLQVTDTENLQLDDADADDRLRTTLTDIASRKPQLVFVADDDLRYLRNYKEVRDELAAAGFSAVKPQQPLLDTKKQKAFALPDAPESPTSDGNKS